MSNVIIVCSACGEHACATGSNVCEDYLRARSAFCTCEWSHADGRPDLLQAIDPACEVHGADSDTAWVMA